MRRIVIRTANVALFVLSCFIAAGIVSDLGAELLLPAAETAFVPTPPAKVQRESWPQRQVILSRNLFGAMVSTDEAPQIEEPLAVIQEEVEDTELPLRLLGTVASTNKAVSHAAIEDKNTRTHEVLKEGELLENHPQVKLVRIERRQVILDNSGIQEKLALDELNADGGPVAAKAPARPSRPKRTARTSRRSRRPTANPEGEDSRNRLADRLQKLRDENERAGDSPQGESDIPGLSMRTQAALLSQARIMPSYVEGEMRGVEINKIKPDSIYERAGFQDGDVVRSVNGIEINNPGESQAFMKELSQADQWDMVYERDGQEYSVTVNAAEIEGAR